jgi:hypothetical protein
MQILIGVLAALAIAVGVQSCRLDRAQSSLATAKADAAELQTWLDAERENASQAQRLAAAQLERDELKEPLIKEVIRNVYRERVVEVSAGCAPEVAAVLAPIGRALDGVHRARAETNPAAAAGGAADLQR